VPKQQPIIVRLLPAEVNFAVTTSPSRSCCARHCTYNHESLLLCLLLQLLLHVLLLLLRLQQQAIHQPKC
jgi:hypothetical protein